MQNDPLVSIIGDQARAKILRLVFLNPTKHFTADEIKSTLKIDKKKITDAFKNLEKENIVKSKKINIKEIKKVIFRGKRKEKFVTRKENGYSFNTSFKFQPALENLIIHTMPSDREALISKITKLKGIKVLVTTGMFSGNQDQLVDVMIVGSDICEAEVTNILAAAEKLIGLEIRYILFDTNEFVHRLNTSDKVVRDILDYPHQIHIDKQEILENSPWI